MVSRSPFSARYFAARFDEALPNERPFSLINGLSLVVRSTVVFFGS